jgi:signal transduction histidine kinase
VSGVTLSRALAAIAVLTSLLVVVAGTVMWDAGSTISVVELGVGACYVAVGLVSWQRRPRNRMGALVVVAGLLFLVASLEGMPYRALATVAAILAGQAVVAGVLHLLLAFPSGHLSGLGIRCLVASAYLVSTVLLVPQFVADSVFDGTVGATRSWIGGFAFWMQVVLLTAILLVGVVALFDRWRRSADTARQRRARAVVYGVGGVVLLFVPISGLLLPYVLDWTDPTRFLIQILGLAVIPFVIAAAILVGGFSVTGRLDDLGAWLGDHELQPLTVRGALAANLGDDSLELLFRSAEDDTLVDSSGQAVDDPIAGGRRAAVDVQAQDGDVAVITYDPTLIADPDIVRSAGRMLALAIERERLTADLIAGRRQLHDSRARIVEVADEERRRVAQDLHDSLQGRLLVAALHAGTLAATQELAPQARACADDLRVELEDAISHLRRVVHGLMPALLIERGLPAAAEDLLDRCPIPVDVTWGESLDDLPVAVATGAYYILAELLTNVVKHSDATVVSVRLGCDQDTLELVVGDDGVGGVRTSGGGLRGVRDRAEALAGSVSLISPAGGGTRLTVRVPCA